MNEKKELYYEEGINEQLPETVPALTSTNSRV
jgi:hypothetical protein